MKQTRRRNKHMRAQGGQRTALPFTRIDAPVGGWNTRDSEDNLPPTDALELDNWWPDIGEIRTRPGYTEHCYTGDALTGSDLVLNGGFETAGGGGADVFANWVESNNNGTIAQSSSYAKAGTYSCRLSIKTNVGGSYAQVEQAIAVTEETPYILKFWWFVEDRYSTMKDGIKYRIWDAIGSAVIKDWESFNYISEDFTEEVAAFETPTGCTSIEIEFKTADVTDSAVLGFVDAVTLFETASTPGVIETLAEYISGSNRQLIAIDGEEAFNVSSSTPVHLSGSIAAFDNARFQWVNFDGKMGLVNGAEELVWDGTNLTTYAAYAPGSIALTGVSTPIGINVFKNRVWYWEAASQDVWYTELNALGGDCTKFPLSRVGQFGGNLILMETWTRDGGSGPDDYAVFVMSSGEAIVYQGSYPGAAGDWALVGIYNIGEPLGYRSAVKFGGDLYIITKLDVVRMSEVIQGIEARQMESKIVPSHRIAVKLYENNWGWEASIYPKGHMAIFNIPVNENTEMDQHVQNTITGAWCRFKGIVANTWQMFNGSIYIGSNDGYIYKFDDGQEDNADSIESTLQTAWMPIGGTGGNKLFKAVRESYKTNADVTVNNVFATDFRAFAAQNFPVAVDDAASYWSILPSTDAVSPWDTSPWTGEDTIFNEWEIIGAFGERISMRKRLNTKQRVTLLGSDWLVEPGDRL